MSGGIERIRLDDGTVVWARVGGETREELDDEDGYRDTGAGDRVFGLAGGLAGTVGGVVRSLRAGLDTTESVEVAVSFGIELTAQSGRIVSAIAGAGGQAALSVSLTWTEPARAAGAPLPEPRDGDGGGESGTPAPGVV